MPHAFTDPPVSCYPRSSYVSKVVANDRVCREHFRLTLVIDHFPPSEPGQFVQLPSSDAETLPDPGEWEWSPGRVIATDALEISALLNRPFSIAARRDHRSRATIEIIYRVVGVATKWLASRTSGAAMTVIGPVGNRFSRPPDRSTALLVGGGVGIPPMLFGADRFRPAKCIAFVGAVSRDLLPLTITAPPDASGLEARPVVREFARFGADSIVTTDDGSLGRRGYVTDALRDWLATHRDEPTNIYACGPELMLKAVAALAGEFSVPCEVAVERAMACGLGTCQSCVIRVRDGDGWKYKLSCTDGPVFAADRLLW